MRELRDRISKLESAAGKAPEVEEESSGKTETFDEGTDDEKTDENSDDPSTTSENVAGASSRGRKRTRK